jgi:anti-sigma-K factor RskA
VTAEALRELCPLAALGALDGLDLRSFEAAGPLPEDLRRELHSFERVVARIGTATRAVPPPAALRTRVLAGVEREAPPTAAAAPPPLKRPAGLRAALWLSWAAVFLLAGLTLLLRQERDAARREAARATAELETLAAHNRDLRRQTVETTRRLEDAQAFRALVAHPGSRMASLGGLPAAPAARGRVVWNAARREAVLLATGLPSAPEGRIYEAWVIADGAPVRAGLFRPDEAGAAVHALPRLDEVARVRTFAVTVEPEGGSAAPTGPMVLAGAAS